MNNLADLLQWLENFYLSHCDGDWEHTAGITIATLDNPGWSVSIDLHATNMEQAPFVRIETERNDGDWLHCWKKNGVWQGRGGGNNLREIISLFKTWSEKSGLKNVTPIQDEPRS